MVVYYVQWERDKDLAQGTGRAKNDEYFLFFTVLCRNSTDAITALRYIFDEKFSKSNLCLEDGKVTLRRSKIDSRNFTCNYIFMDGIRHPLSLSDFKKSLFHYKPY